MASRRLPVSYDSKMWGRVETLAVENPSARAVATMFAAARGNQLRGVAWEDDLFVFPAYEANHYQVRAALGLPQLGQRGCCDIWIVAEDAEPHSNDWESSDEDPIRDGMRLILGRDSDIPALHRLIRWFGAQPKPEAPAWR